MGRFRFNETSWSSPAMPGGVPLGGLALIADQLSDFAMWVAELAGGFVVLVLSAEGLVEALVGSVCR
jgi:hypothetical protein